MKNLEKIEKVKELFNEGVKLLKQIDISEYIKEDIIEDSK